LTSQPANDVTELVVRAAGAASSKKAENIVILDVSRQLVITDFFLICSGNTERHVGTIAEEIERRLQQQQSVKPVRREGERHRRWVVLDYIDFVVHVFHKEDRDYYELERLWADAREVPFEDQWEDGNEPAAAEAT
jgi:ribosome-associated protein